LFVGTWGTSFEELPEIEISREEAREASARARNVTPKQTLKDEKQGLETRQTTLTLN
jgi:hypothetical protein